MSVKAFIFSKIFYVSFFYLWYDVSALKPLSPPPFYSFFIFAESSMRLLSIMLFVACLWFFMPEKSSSKLPDQFFLHPVSTVLTVTSLVKHDKCYQSFMAQPTGKDYYYQVAWYQCSSFFVHVGDILESKVVLKPVYSSNSPGAFNAQEWAQQNHVVARATIKSAKKIGNQKSASLNVQRWRERIDRLFEKNITDPQVKAVLESLTLGITHRLSWETIQSFNLSGTRHILSISGSHMGMIAMIAYGVFFFIFRGLIVFLPRMNAHHAAMVMVVLSVAAYSVVSGGQIPTLRAFFMAIISMMSILLSRHSSLCYRIFLVALVFIAFDHDLIYSPSFYLSFYAVFLIAYHQLWLLPTKKKIYAYVQLNVFLFIGLMPMSLFFFSQYSLITLLANVIAIPFAGFLILPATIFLSIVTALGCSAHMAWRGLEMATQFFLSSVHFFSWITLHVPGVLMTGHIQWYQAIILSLVILLSFLPKGMPLRFLGIFAFIPMLYNPSPVNVGQARLVFLNVGQGLSVLIKTKSHLLVYDTGPKFFTGGDVAQSIIIPYLYYHGWKNIDGLVVSHGDADHSGGAKTLRDQFTIPLVWTSDLKRVPNAILCERGQEWHWDGVDFKMLYPDASATFQGNNRSCVLKISVGKTSALLVGDIEVGAENHLIDHLSDELSTNVLSVPHHGSKTSSSENFLNATHPSYAIFSYGFLNRFHFPHPVVVQRYTEHNIQTFVTENGPISLDMSATNLTIFPEQ